MIRKSTNAFAKRKLRIRFRWLGYPLLILAVVAVVHWWRAAPLASGDAPPLAGELVDAGPVDLDSFLGSPVLVHFWATWCPVCRLSDHSINALAEDFEVVTVAMQSGSAGEVAKHLRQEGLSFPTIADPSAEIASRWGVAGVPTSFVLDGKGYIRFATVGHTTEWGLRGRLLAAEYME